MKFKKSVICDNCNVLMEFNETIYIFKCPNCGIEMTLELYKMLSVELDGDIRVKRFGNGK